MMSGKTCMKALTVIVVSLGMPAGAALAGDNYAEIHVGDFDEFESGGGVAVSWGFTDTLRGFGSFSAYDHLDLFEAGVGYAVMTSDNLTVEVGGALQNWDYELGDDGSLGAHVSARFAMSEALTLGVQGQYLVFNDDDHNDGLVVGGELDYSFGGFSAFLGVDLFENFEDSQTRVHVGGRYHF